MAVDRTDTSVANDYWLKQREKSIRVIAWYNNDNWQLKEFSVDDNWSMCSITQDPAWNTPLIGSFSETVVWSKRDDISVQFQYDQLNTDFDLNSTATAVTWDGANTATGSYAQASSATTGTATIQSRDSIRYKPWHTGFADFTAYFSWTGTWYAWPHDDEDGFALKVVNGNLSFGYIKWWVETGSSGAAGFDDQANWNWGYDLTSIDLETLNIFRVTFWYLGVANPTLWIKKDKWHVLHVVKTEWTLTGTHVNDPVFPMRIQAINGMTIRSWSWNGWSIGSGKEIIWSRPFTFPNTIVTSGAWLLQWEVTLSGTTVSTLAIFNSKTTFQWKTNKVKTRLLAYEFHVNIPWGNVVWEVVFQIVKVNTLSWTASYTDINTWNSVMEYDHTVSTWASVTVTDATPIITKHIQYVWSNKGGTVWTASINAESIWAVAYAWETFAILAKDSWGNNVEVWFDLNWEELF